jgi:hypothetical protein
LAGLLEPHRLSPAIRKKRGVSKVRKLRASFAHSEQRSAPARPESSVESMIIAMVRAELTHAIIPRCVEVLMSIYFRKRRSLFGNLLNVNLSKSGLGLSIGVRGFRLGVSSSGRRYVTAGLPGSGIYYRHFAKRGRNSTRPEPATPEISPGRNPSTIFSQPRRFPTFERSSPAARPVLQAAHEHFGRSVFRPSHGPI